MKLLILDSSYLIFKSYFAFKDRQLKVERDGEEINTSAIFGFIREIIHMKTNEKYNFIISVYDSPPYLKRQLSDTYKDRPDKKITIPSFNEEKILIQAILFDLGIPCVYKQGYEGEEVAKSLILKFKDKHKIDFYTNDEDCYALIDKNVALIKTNKGETIKFNTDDLKEKYNVTPKQFVQMKALTGCKSDNITGITGVGPVTASKLINEYGTVNNVIKNIDNIKQKNLRIKIENAIASGDLLLSKKLTKIEAPKNLKLHKPDEELTYIDILEYIDAQSFLKGSNKLILKNIKTTQRRKNEECRIQTLL
jgi:DNA polymerase I